MKRKVCGLFKTSSVLNAKRSDFIEHKSLPKIVRCTLQGRGTQHHRCCRGVLKVLPPSWDPKFGLNSPPWKFFMKLHPLRHFEGWILLFPLEIKPASSLDKNFWNTSSLDLIPTPEEKFCNTYEQHALSTEKEIVMEFLEIFFLYVETDTNKTEHAVHSYAAGQGYFSAKLSSAQQC